MISVKYEINYCWWLLRLMFGISFIGAGIDKFFNLATNWSDFITPAALDLTGVAAPLIMYFVCAIEISLGVLVLTKWAQIASLLITVFMISIGVYLLFSGIFLDTAFRYLSLGVSALVLFHLTRVRSRLD